MPETSKPTPPPLETGWRARLKPWNAFLVDAALLWLFLLMIEFLAIAFSGRRGTGRGQARRRGRENQGYAKQRTR